MEARYRYYRQTAADFYSDLFPRAQHQNYMARDKELSRFHSHAIGAGVSYRFGIGYLPFVSSAEASIFVDRLHFSYYNSSDIRQGAPPGDEPGYKFDATLIRALLSFWF